MTDIGQQKLKGQYNQRVFSHEVTAAMMMYQTNPVRGELVSYADSFVLLPLSLLGADNVNENSLQE